MGNKQTVFSNKQIEEYKVGQFVEPSNKPQTSVIELFNSRNWPTWMVLKYYSKQQAYTYTDSEFDFHWLRPLIETKILIEHRILNCHKRWLI